jgi:hypothetical protein
VAFETVKNDADWTKYIEVVNRNAVLTSSDVNGPETIVAIAKNVSDQVELSKTTLKLAGRTIVVRDVLNKVLEVLSVTKDIGASLTSLNPYASPAWGGLQFFVQAAVTYKDVGELCWNELTRMVRLISRYQTFELLYNPAQLKLTRADLEHALVDLYSAILRYQVVIVKYASLPKDRIKNAFQDVAKSLPQQVLDDITRYEAEVTRMQTFADQEINNMQFRQMFQMTAENAQQLADVTILLQDSLQRSALMQSKTSSQVDGISLFVRDSRRSSILEWISTIKYGNAQDSKERRALTGTGEWLIRGEAYRNWRTSTSPSHLWLNGSIGSGKSCLTHLVIKDIQEMILSSEGTSLAYFYCAGGSSDNAEAVQILKSLLRQLSVVDVQGTLSQYVVNAYDDTHLQGDLSDTQCMTLLGNVINSRDTTIIILDGLDECVDIVQRDILSELAALQNQSLSTTKIFVSSRPTEPIRRRLIGLDPIEISTFENNTADIMTYIQSRVDEAGYGFLYHKDGRIQEDAVRNKIISKAGGMFRWAELAFNFLHDSIDFDAMSCRLEQLSHIGKLFELYDKIYDDILQRLHSHDKARITTLLMFMLHADYATTSWSKSTLPYAKTMERVAEILEACEFSATGDLFRPPLSIERVRLLCPSLVVVIAGNVWTEFAFPHVSVREWLLTGDKRSCQFSGAKGQCFLAQLCLKVICATKSQAGGSPSVNKIRANMPGQPVRLTALQSYSCQAWLHHSHAAIAGDRLHRIAGTMWDEETVLRIALEDFLFDLDSKPGSSSLRLSVTGLQLWHVLGRIVLRSRVDIDIEKGRRYRFMLPRALKKYKRIPSTFMLPAFICAVLGYYCDLSRFNETAMRVDISPYDWQVRSLAAVMVVGDIKASEWLVEQLQPSPDVLANALLLTFSLELWPSLEYDSEEGLHLHTTISQLVQLLTAYGLDVNGRYEPSKVPLIVSLVNAWNEGKSRDDIYLYIATMTACFIEEGADTSISVTAPEEKEVFGNLTSSELVAVFDWFWFKIAEVETSRKGRLRSLLGVLAKTSLQKGDDERAVAALQHLVITEDFYQDRVIVCIWCRRPITSRPSDGHYLCIQCDNIQLCGECCRKRLKRH